MATDLTADLRDCLEQQDVVPLIHTTIEFDDDDVDNGHNGFAMRHEYEVGKIRVHIGNCFDPEALERALHGTSKVHEYASLTELLATWRLD